MLQKVVILFYYIKTKYFHNFADKTSLEKWQKSKIKKFVAKMIDKSPFYKSYLKEWQKLSMEKWPLVDKKIMMDNFDDFNTAGIKLKDALEVAIRAEEDRDFSPKLGKYSVGLSSGTSGVHGVFLISPLEQAKWCGTILAKMLPCSIFKKQKVAFFLRADNNLYESIKSRLIEFRFFDLKKDLENNLSELNKFQPDILAAPPNMLNIIADAQENCDIQISPVKIVSVADVLYENIKKKLENIFQQKIHQIYQATEGFIACTCKYGNLHLNEDILFVRKKYLDENSGRFMPIITDFNRTTQPVINYELNDILIEDSEKCPCQSPFTVIKKIEGRCDDILYYEDIKNNKHIVFADFIVRTILKHIPKAEDFLFTQTDINNAILSLPDAGEYKELLKSLKKIIPINITIETLKRSKDLSLKQKRISRKFNL
ncbi:MAG: adenylate synthase [Campylobacteraceae bacterium]|jgi:putative adenylate-forming enzyme|nr:adenylate synthase [Campylobacteraceae bacterium]